MNTPYIVGILVGGIEKEGSFAWSGLHIGEGLMWRLLGEIWCGMRRSAVEKDGGVSIFPPGPQTALEASGEELQADTGADHMRVFVRFWSLSKIMTRSWEKYIIFFSRVRS